MLNYTLFQTINYLYGENTTEQLPEILQEKGYKKPLLIFDAGVKAAGIIDKITKALEAAGIAYSQFDKVQSDPPIAIINEGCEFAKSEGIDAIVAIGGGSSMDTAKGINILRFNEGPLWKYAAPMSPMTPATGLIVIPTTSGTGSELSNGLVATNEEGVKILFLNTLFNPEAAIVDPLNYVGQPVELTKAVGLDVLAHAMESELTILSSLPTQFISEKAAEIVVEWLPKAVADGSNVEARSYIAVAASFGGWCLTLAAACVGHSFGHVIGAKLHIPHGLTVAYALPLVLEWNARAVPQKIKRLGAILGVEWSGNESNEEIGKKARAAAEKFIYETIGIKKFKDWNPDPSLKDDIAEGIVNEVAMPLTPEPMPIEQVKEYLDQLYAY
ncbi:MAG: iron-containing alcohol dehydrogenase [Clostridiales Family XIII bacterium]|jgi:alcohol dehydrogenase class IV|nr:iron-containing alcohol dehydrogenase [Clostridiales Family XIII bacterium]